MSWAYQKPAERRGMICHWVRWNLDGSIREARYRPLKEARQEAAQGELL